jgi:alkanesulfonate monooxygenase SsuD/methylene tetrahydromethanopterin reductase-like flavin-dependent oxidoreductase (luciferase family)
MPEFGLFIPQMRMSPAVITERVQAAEAAGFQSVWLMDHLVPPGLPSSDCYEAYTLAAALAVQTERVRIGHLVGCSQFRHPTLLAKMVVTIDHLSGGRFDLGLGWGSVPAELDTFGLLPEPPALRSQRLEETLEILELLFTGEPFDYDGRHHQLRGAQQRPRPLAGKVPVLIGGIGEKLTLPLVRRFADWWNCPSYGIHRLEELRPLVGDVKVSTQHPIGLAVGRTDRDDVVALAEKRFGNWGGLIAGTPDEVAAELAREAALGVELFLVPFSDFATVETIERFGREVMPAVRAGVGA